MNPGLTKSYTQGAIVNPSRIVKWGSADDTVIQATDGSAVNVGISVENIAGAAGEPVDVIRGGIAYLELGDTVTRGQYLKADANGKGVPVTIVAGTPVYCVGTADLSGVAGDIIPVKVGPVAIANDTGIVQADIVVTTEQLLALHATPKQLVAAPGLGKAIILVDAQLRLVWNSAAYDGIAAGEDLEIRYTNGAGQLVATVETTGFVDATADAFRHIYPAAAAAIAPVANAALVLDLASGEIATGDSALHVRVRYRTVDLAI
jgi:hypothetical protein